MTKRKVLERGPARTTDTFIKTKEYKRFAEFCDACKRDRYIGVCYGPPGVGKSFSARKLAHWDEIELFSDFTNRRKAPIRARNYDTIVYTAPVINSARDVEKGITKARCLLFEAILSSYRNYRDEHLPYDSSRLIIVDEADRLKMQGIEQLRSVFDADGVAIILIGMPGIQKRLARYPQLYSRVGFVHEFRMLSQDEIVFLIKRRLSKCNELKIHDFNDPESLAAILRITQGNFRLLNRLLSQVLRILEINGLHKVTKEVIEAARENLVIGVS